MFDALRIMLEDYMRGDPLAWLAARDLAVETTGEEPSARCKADLDSPLTDGPPRDGTPPWATTFGLQVLEARAWFVAERMITGRD